MQKLGHFDAYLLIASRDHRDYWPRCKIRKTMRCQPLQPNYPWTPTCKVYEHWRSSEIHSAYAEIDTKSIDLAKQTDLL